MLETKYKLPEAPKRQQQAIQEGAAEARKMIGSRIEEVNPELKYMGKTHQDQPIEVRGINPTLNYRKANETGMVGA